MPTRLAGGRKSREAATANALSWEAKKRLSNRKKQLPLQRDQVLHALDAAETRKKELELQWGDPAFYERAAPGEIEKLQAEEKDLALRIEQLTREWETLEREIESLEL